MILRLAPIMFLKLPIMPWSNARDFCLLYAPYVINPVAILHKFNISFPLSYFNHKITSISVFLFIYLSSPTVCTYLAIHIRIHVSTLLLHFQP